MRNRLSVVTAAAIGVLVGLGAFTFHYAEGFSYFSDDPRACANCHVMIDHYDSWQKSSHHATATCVDCHLPHGGTAEYVEKARNGFLHSKAFTLESFHEPIMISPANARTLHDNCLRCHQDLVGGIVAPDPHGAASLDCVRCHSAVGHGSPR